MWEKREEWDGNGRGAEGVNKNRRRREEEKGSKEWGEKENRRGDERTKEM